MCAGPCLAPHAAVTMRVVAAACEHAALEVCLLLLAAVLKSPGSLVGSCTAVEAVPSAAQ
jgi:hypothetical protein